MIPQLPEEQSVAAVSAFLAELRSVADTVLYGAGDPDWIAESTTLSWAGSDPDRKSYASARIKSLVWTIGADGVRRRIVFQADAQAGRRSLRITGYDIDFSDPGAMTEYGLRDEDDYRSLRTLVDRFVREEER